MIEPAPVAVFAYNRLDHIQRTMEALSRNAFASQTELHIFSDAARSVEDREKVANVRRYLSTVKGFKSVRIVEQSANLGLAGSIIGGVSSLFKRYERLVVLEDDIVTSPDYLAFTNEALDVYSAEPRVFSVTGFNFPISIDPTYSFDAYFSYRCNSWGWATWRDRWNRVDWEVKDYEAFRSDRSARHNFNRGGNDLADMLDLQLQGKIDSWAIRWCFAHSKHNAFCLFPVKSRVQNIGFDGSGVHCTPTGRFTVELEGNAGTAKLRFPLEVEPNCQIQQAFYRFNSMGLKGRVKSFLKRLSS